MLIVVTGPTATGKSRLSLALAKKYNAEIINADAMQVYEKLNIGTAKIKDMENIPHHLIDFIDINDSYNVYRYQIDARKMIDKLTKEGKNIILVGGSAHYIKACLYDYNFEKETKTYDFSSYTNIELLNKIKTYDKNTTIHVNNRKRLERYLTKFLNNSSSTKSSNKLLYDTIFIGLTLPRDILYDRINKRVDEMINEGLFDEVKSLYDNNIHTQAVNTAIGYKELYNYFDGKISKEDAIDLIKKNSRHYAKRQYTYLLHQLNITWFETNIDDFSKTVEEICNYIKERL